MFLRTTVTYKNESQEKIGRTFSGDNCYYQAYLQNSEHKAIQNSTGSCFAWIWNVVSYTD